MNNILINKECTKCKTTKPITDFYKCGNNYQYICKKCMNEYSIIYYKNNRSKMAEYSKEYYKNNREKHDEYTKQYYKNNLEKIRNYNKKRNSKNKERMKEWTEEQREEYLEKHRILKRAWDRKAMQDPMHRLSNNLRGNMYHALKAKKGFRKWEDLVGYTLQDLINHITPKLDGIIMNWENYGTVWHVDHITPKSWFKYENTSDPKFKECWALSNLQPKLKIENIKKGNRFSG